MKKLIIFAVIAVIVVIVGLVVVNANTPATPTPASKASPTSTIQASDPPTISQAPYLVKTQSRYYYAKEATQKLGITTLKDYWEFIKGRWTRQPGTLEMDEKVFGKITVSKRTK